MKTSVHRARQRTSHGPAPKPRGIVAMHTARSPHRHAQRTGAVAALMRLVGRLTADAAGDASRLQAHRHYVAGYLTAMEAAGVLPHPQLLTLQHTCEVLLEGPLTLQDITAMKRTGN